MSRHASDARDLVTVQRSLCQLSQIRCRSERDPLAWLMGHSVHSKTYCLYTNRFDGLRRMIHFHKSTRKKNAVSEFLGEPCQGTIDTLWSMDVDCGNDRQVVLFDSDRAALKARAPMVQTLYPCDLGCIRRNSVKEGLICRGTTSEGKQRARSGIS